MSSRPRVSGRWEVGAAEVMKAVMSHPCAKMFAVPPIVGDDFPEDYFRVISNPMDFTTILACLSRHKYKTPDDWLRAVNLVFDNTKRYYREGSVFDLSAELQTVFRRIYAKVFGVMSIPDWCREVLRLRDKIGKLEAAPPSVIMSSFPIGRKVSSQLPTDKDVKLFLTAMTKLTKTQDHDELLALIREQEPGIPLGEGKIQIDILAMKPATIRIATEWVRARLEREGIAYPS